jgi:hypothetical protein
LVAPTLSIGSILLQQAAISASFHYRNIEIVESKANANVRVYVFLYSYINIKRFAIKYSLKAFVE